MNLSGLAVAAAIVLLAAAGPARASAGEELVFFTWSEYIDPEVVAEFESETGARVKFVYYESDDLRTRTLAESDGRGYDLMIVNGLNLAPYARRGWLAPLAFDSMPNTAHVEPRWRDAFPDARTHGTPFFWGTLGIAYRRDLVATPPAAWRDLFEPAPDLRGRIVMMRSTRDLLGMALKTLGFSANSVAADEIERAGALLLAQKPFVMSYSYVALTEASVLVTGKAAAAIMYSGDALMLKDIDDRIEYVVPREGSNLWVDYLAISASSPRKALAARFIDFLNRPEIAARNAEYLHYASPNAAALALLPEEFRRDPIIFPGADVRERSEAYRELPPRAMKRATAAVARVVN